jgi:hypothetical protein
MHHKRLAHGKPRTGRDCPEPRCKQRGCDSGLRGADMGWRGWFAIHTWIAAKPTDEQSYMVYEVVGWRQRRGLPVVRIEKDLPDRYWFGERPLLLKEFRGDGVDKLIAAVDHAAKSYPWARRLQGLSGTKQQHVYCLDSQTGSRTRSGASLFSHWKRIFRLGGPIIVPDFRMVQLGMLPGDCRETADRTFLFDADREIT